MTNKGDKNMLEIHCSGTPFEIGHTHGSVARAQVHGSLAFYQAIFQDASAMDWPGVCHEASAFVPTLEKLCPRYLDEMRGIADGAGVDLLDIVALNVRTEIMFGLFSDPDRRHEQVPSDGCTSLALKLGGGGPSLLSQNWDWRVEQGRNIVLCHIAAQPGTGAPALSTVTEAGAVAKLGINAAGVGVCLNAIRARGVDRTRLPVHAALRAVLESPSRAAAVERLEAVGVAASAHVFVADASGATGLECTARGIRRLEQDGRGVLAHTNHLLAAPHEGVEEPPWLVDSSVRVARMRQLVDEKLAAGAGLETPSELLELYKDEEGYPNSINRQQEGDPGMATIFNIIMNLTKRQATITMGRPTDGGEQVEVSF